MKTKCNPSDFSAFSATEYFTTLPLRTEMGTNAMQISMYPNPADQEITIELGISDVNAFLQIFTTTGAAVKSYQLTESSTFIDISNLAKGLYLVNITSEGMSHMRQLVVD